MARTLRFSASAVLALAVACSSGQGISDDATPDAGSSSGSTPKPAPSSTSTPGNGDAGSGPSVATYPAPDGWPKNKGPGGPNATFTEDQLYVNCAFLDGGAEDVTDHHNTVTMLDGYLLLPWAPEYGAGGFTFFDVSSPCAPKRIGGGTSSEMRESHSIGFSHHGGRWAVVDAISQPILSNKGGIQFWDVKDAAAPKAVKRLDLPGFLYPDAYARVTLSVFWQVPYVFVGGADNGVYVVDATDPMNPKLVTQYAINPTARVGQVQAVGNLLVVTTAESPRTVLLDVSDPAHPQPIPGGDFLARESAGGPPREAYFSNFAAGFIYYARKEGAGGLMVYDVRDPSNPTWAGGKPSDGNGGYVFVKDNLAFTGESSFAAIYDVSNPAAITEVKRLNLKGDLDTMTPIGNVAVLSVDDEADTNKGSAIAPYALTPDKNPPTVTWSWPKDGATNLPLGSRFGVTLSEMVDSGSAWEGSVRVYAVTDNGEVKVDGYVSAQENIVNFVPKAPLSPNTKYVFEIPAGGLVDFNGNAIAQPFKINVTTAGK